MDFKVAGTKEVDHRAAARHQARRHPASVLAGALKQARGARMTILEVMREAIDAARRDEPLRAADRPRSRCRCDKIGEVDRPQGQDHQRHHRRDRCPDLQSRTTAPCTSGATEALGTGRDRPDQRHRQPAAADGRRTVPRNRGEDDGFRRIRVAAARKDGLVHISKLRQGQAHREGRGRGEHRRQAASRDRRHRQPRQDLVGPGGREEGADNGPRPPTPGSSRRPRQPMPSAEPRRPAADTALRRGKYPPRRN